MQSIGDQFIETRHGEFLIARSEEIILPLAIFTPRLQGKPSLMISQGGKNSSED